MNDDYLSNGTGIDPDLQHLGSVLATPPDPEGHVWFVVKGPSGWVDMNKVTPDVCLDWLERDNKNLALTVSQYGHITDEIGNRYLDKINWTITLEDNTFHKLSDEFILEIRLKKDIGNGR